jgi:hypothetical protein
LAVARTDGNTSIAPTRGWCPTAPTTAMARAAITSLRAGARHP